jgi:hypothetical protein
MTAALAFHPSQRADLQRQPVHGEGVSQGASSRERPPDLLVLPLLRDVQVDHLGPFA